MATAESPSPTVDLAGEQVAGVLALLDAAKRLGCYTNITLWAEHYEDGIAEHALRLWASANALPLVDHTHEYIDSGYSIRSLEVRLDAQKLMHGCARVQWPSVPLALPQPVPGVVIEPPVDSVIPLPVAEPRIAQVVEPAQPASIDEACTRFSLLELD